MLAVKDSSERRVRVGRPKVSRKLEDEVIRLYNDDCPIREISKTCGVAISTIYRILRDRRKEQE